MSIPGSVPLNQLSIPYMTAFPAPDLRSVPPAGFKKSTTDIFPLCFYPMGLRSFLVVIFSIVGSMKL
jgi:hypothetical protein